MYVCVAENCEMLVFFFLFSPTIVRIDNYLSESRFWTIWDGILATRGCYACHETMYCFSFLRFCAFFKIFHIQLEEKRKNVSFYTVYVCVKVKLTFVSFFCAPFPKPFFRNPQCVYFCLNNCFIFYVFPGPRTDWIY